MRELESSRHLFQPPLFRGSAGCWTHDFETVLRESGDAVHLDITAVASYLSFGFVCQDRTLLREITRRSWLSRVSDTGELIREAIPPHGFTVGSDEGLADRLWELLRAEARTVCEGFSEIYVLLSGGLDSRIVAGVLARLDRDGELPAKPIALTWGLPNSRDVVYGAQIAKLLGLEWQNIPLGPDTVLENVQASASLLGMMQSPEMLHSMLWFRNLPPSSLVIAGSFGDSIGRAEFMGQHLLELKRRSPWNAYQVMRPAIFRCGCAELNRDLKAIYTRATGDVPPYAPNEHWMQGCRMRGGLCHVLSIINRYAYVYQMFTAPSVYEYMWSLHPVRRDNNIYAALLKRELPELVRVPWSRINRAAHGSTTGARRGLLPDYHEYTKWSSGPLYSELSERIDPDWFEATGIFDPVGIREMNAVVKASQVRVGRLNDVWLWLAGFRAFVEHIENGGTRLIIDADGADDSISPRRRETILRKLGAMAASKSVMLNAALKGLRARWRKIRLKRLKRHALRDYPPIGPSSQT